VVCSATAVATATTTTGRIANMTNETPIYNQMQKHYAMMRETIRIEQRIELVKQLKAIKKPVKQVQDLIKEYENAEIKNT
jgi:hypothetical protein